MKGDRETFPARLAEGADATAELLRKVEKQPAHAPPEAAAWERTLTRLGRNTGHSRLRLAVAAGAGALAGAVALFIALSPRAQLRTETDGAVVAAAPRAGVEARGTGRALTEPGSPRSLPASRSASSPVIPSPVLPSPVLPSPVLPSPALPSPLAPTPVAPTSAPAVAVEATEAPRIQLGRAPVGLPAGRAELLGEASVTLSRGGHARAFTTTAAATVELGAGEVELHVEKRPVTADHAFEVTAAGYRFTVLGTVFRVSRANDDVTLSVSEGRVAVSRIGAARADQPLTVVTGGGFWSGSSKAARPLSLANRTSGSSSTATLRTVNAAVAEPHDQLALAGAPALAIPSATKTPAVPTVEPAPFAPPVPVKAISPAASPSRAPRAEALAGACASRANAAPRDALECFLSQTGGSNLGAQVALYEAARLYGDALGDTGHAIGALRELRRRFPDGALAVEAELSLAELLPKVGRYREALEASAAALESQPARERADELHLLRGDLLRAGLGDCARAAVEYAAADNANHDNVADPAAFGRALCLEKLGRGAEARQAFERYLARPNARRAGEAARHLRDLGHATP